MSSYTNTIYLHDVLTCPSRLGMSLLVLGPRVGRTILWGGHPVLRQRRRMDAEVDGAGPSAMVVEKDVVGPSARPWWWRVTV